MGAPRRPPSIRYGMLRLRMAIREAREHFILVGALVLLTVAAVAFNWSGNDYLKNLGPNLVAGFVGSALTIYGLTSF
jgi:hypothetical protein